MPVGARCRSRATSDMLVAPSAIAAAVSTRTVPRSSSGDLPFSSGAAEQRGQARDVSGLAEQDGPGMADQSLSCRGDLQGMVPPVKLHGEDRSSSGT